MSADVPETVPCPCGNGYAERKPEHITEPGPRRKRRTIYHYRHTGCLIGGTIVVEFGRIVRKLGPLFDPDRFGIGEIAPASTERVLADGGEVVE